MKFLYTSLFIFCVSITLAFSQGAEGFNRFHEKSGEFNSGSFVGENGINWDFIQCRNFSAADRGGIEKSGIELKSDSTAEINSSVISGGIGFLKIEYSALTFAPVKLDVFVNRLKVITLDVPASDKVAAFSSDNIPVNIDKPFYIRIKQSNETAGQVIIDKVLWSQFSSTDYGELSDNIIPEEVSQKTLNPVLQTENTASYHVYPNPAKEYVLIEMTETHNVLFKLYTLAGQMVLQEQVLGSGQKISLSTLKEGLYIYKILDDKGKLITGKMIIR